LLKIKEFLKNSYDRMSIFYLLVFIMWIKSYLIQKFMFELPITTLKQEFILFISPLSSTLLFMGLAVFFSRRKTRAMIVMNFMITIVLYANVVYYRFFNDFITIPVLMQTSNMGDLGSSVTELMNPSDLILFLDIIVLGFLLWKNKIQNKSPLKREVGAILLAVVGVFFFNLVLAETERPELLTRTFDREMLVKNLGTNNYLIYDMVLQTKTKTQRAFADTSVISDIEEYTKQKYLEPSDEMFGIAKGKNVILISLESTQNFVINNKVNDQEITPFLNKIVKESFYFDNFYHQTGQGKTSDAEFIVDNSLYGLPRGAVYFTHSSNEFRATPEILKENGYYAAAFHANNKSFWNRDVMYKTVGYNHYYAEEYYDINDDNSVGWGLKDKEFFTQSVDLLEGIPQPFYAKFLTLTNHHPFELDDSDKTIDEFDSNSKTLNQYFPTVRYLDESLEQFFEQLKEKGLYENSIIVMYGDHYGISENHNKAMAKYLMKEKITAYDHIELQKVPFIIHIPGMEGKTISTVSGQIDIKPTLLHLLGIETKGGIDFGQDLFQKDENDSLAVLRDGSFVTKDYVYSKNKCYQKTDGMQTEDTYCEPYMEKAKNELQYSDWVIYGDLFRFIKQKNIEKDKEKGS